MFRLRARVLLESVYKEQETPPLVGTLRQSDDVLPPVMETSVHVHYSKSEFDLGFIISREYSFGGR